MAQYMLLVYHQEVDAAEQAEREKARCEAFIQIAENR